jgi:hypothetical protein
MKKIDVNLHYLSRVLGPLALASEIDQDGDLLGSVDFTNPAQCKLVLDYLVVPSFRRMDESSKSEVRKALGFCVQNADEPIPLIEDKLEYSRVPPENARVLLLCLWDCLFGQPKPSEYSLEQCRISRKPLAWNQIRFIGPEEISLEQQMLSLQEHMLSG